MKNLMTIILIGVFLCCPINIVMADQPATNEQFVVNSVSGVAKALIDSLRLTPTRVKIQAQSGLSGLVVDGFTRALLESGFTIIGGDNPFQGNDLSIDVSFSAFVFNYYKGKSRGFLKRHYVRREASGQVLVKISGDKYNYIEFKDFIKSDEVEPSQVNYVASIRYNQMAPKAPGGGVMKYLEPLAVTATVGGLVYLFFINR